MQIVSTRGAIEDSKSNSERFARISLKKNKRNFRVNLESGATSSSKLTYINL